MALSELFTYFQQVGEWRITFFAFNASCTFPQRWRNSTNKTPVAGDMARLPDLVLISSPQCKLQHHFHHPTTPPALHRKPITTFSHNMHLTMNLIAEPLTEALRCPEIDDFLTFFENETVFYYFRQKERGDRDCCLAPCKAGKPAISADRIDEPAPAVALRLYLYVLPTIARLCILITTTRGKCPDGTK